MDDVFSQALRDRNSRLKRGEETLTMQGGSMTGNWFLLVTYPVGGSLSIVVLPQLACDFFSTFLF